MQNSLIKLIPTLVSVLLLMLARPLFADSPERWFSEKQVQQGQILFQQNCASCHGSNAEATPNWKKTDENGVYPPPPLDGSAHAWHHDLSLLRRTVREGGQKLGGQMPPFEQVLMADQIDSVIAFFQSKWTDDIYTKWAGRFESNDSLPSLDDISKLIKQPNTTYLKQRLGKTVIGQPKASPLKDLYEIRFNDKTLYLSEDGQYAIIGEMIDLKKGVNLSKQKP